MIYTFETKLILTPEEKSLLNRDIQLWSSTYRNGFSHYSKNQDETALYYQLKAITNNSNQSKSISNNILGQYSAQKELQKYHQKQLIEKIIAIKKTIQNLKKQLASQQKKLKSSTGNILRNLQTKNKKQITFIKRKEQLLQSKERKLQNLQLQIKNNKISVCFGSKKLFKQRKEAKTTEEVSTWKDQWELARNHYRVAIGDKSKPYGNPEIQYIATTNKIRIRLSEKLVQERRDSDLIKGILHCRFIELDCTGFAYLEKLALKFKQSIAKLISEKPITAKILRKENGFYVQLSLDIVSPVKTVGIDNTLGIDFNADGLGYLVLKPDGNRKSHCKGFSHLENMTEQSLSEELDRIFTYGSKNGCQHIAIENLEFFQKKAHLRTGKKHNKPYNKMLSQLRYEQFQSLVIRKAERLGLQVHLVNPAYSSLAGYVKWGYANKESADVSAPQAIARQALYGKNYTKKHDLEHITRHQLKQESISNQGYFYRANQRKNTGNSQGNYLTTWREMGKVLGKRSQWKVNLRDLQRNAWLCSKEVTKPEDKILRFESENITTADYKQPLAIKDFEVAFQNFK